VGFGFLRLDLSCSGDGRQVSDADRALSVAGCDAGAILIYC
jgi:hypothetical protein